MEAAAVGSLTRKVVDVAVDPLLEDLLSRAKKRFYFVLNLEDEIHNLRKVLPDLKKVIWSTEVKPETAEMRRALQDFVEDAEDILDEFDTKAARRLWNQAGDKRRNRCKIKGLKVRGLIPSRLKFANKIKGLYDGLEKLKSDEDKRRQFVASAKEGLHLVKKVEGETELLSRPITDELLSKDFHFVGREKMKEEVTTELLSEPLSKTSVVLITGMGGIGKTTFVKDIFRTPNVDRHFDVMKWVCVGDELDPKTVMSKIIGRAVEDRTEIRSELEGKRFFMVLDDCWSGKLKRWKELWDPLTYGSDGSKIIITSREDISRELSPAFVKQYPLDILSDKECLEIFQSYAFPYRGPSTSSSCPSANRLQEISEEIVKKKVKGLPLAAMVLGSTLCNENQESTWNDVLTRISEDDCDIMPVLMWSYRRLPSHLKQCFAYLSLFPKDYQFKKEDVVWMWMAQDYVPAVGRLGENYFDYLVRASLIQKTSLFNSVDDDYYSMHDLIHDLARTVLGGSYIPPSENYAHSNVEITRHLLIEDYSSFEKYSNNNKKLQTLLNYCGKVDSSKFQLQHVRALSLPYDQDLTRINFSRMIHLRYLDLTRVQANALPESICSLYNLQTLLLHSTGHLGTWDLPNLRYLIGGEYVRKIGIGKSTSLQTISAAMGGEDIEELENLKELRGKLVINQLNLVQSPQSASKAQLHDKEYIEELVLKWEGFINSEDSTRIRMQSDILEKLKPHGNLRILRIAKYMGDQTPSWMRKDCLDNLVKLELSHLHHIKELPPLGHLLKFKYLHIKELKCVRCMGNEFYGTKTDIFPSLKELFLKDMEGLEEWMDSTYHKDRITVWFPSLNRLEIWGCKKLRSLPHLPRNLKMLGIESTGLEVLPEIWTCSDRSVNYDLPRLKALKIKQCPSLCPNEWFRKYRMPSLSRLRLNNVGSCTNLAINCSRKRLKYLSIEEVPALRSITFSNIVPVNEFKEADYPKLSITLRHLDALDDIYITNGEEEEIRVGSVEAVGCSNRASMLQENASKIMMITNVNHLSTDNWEILLRVDPRKLVKLQMSLRRDLFNLEDPDHYLKRLRRWFQNLSSLQELEIFGTYLNGGQNYSWLRSLPLHNLSSLKSLKFRHCGQALEYLQELPPSLKKEGLKFYV